VGLNPHKGYYLELNLSLLQPGGRVLFLGATDVGLSVCLSVGRGVGLSAKMVRCTSR